MRAIPVVYPQLLCNPILWMGSWGEAKSCGKVLLKELGFYSNSLRKAIITKLYFKH